MAKLPRAAGGVFLITRQLLEPSYKSDVFLDAQQRLAFIRMLGMARYADSGALKRGQMRESVRQIAERCEMSLGSMGRLLSRMAEDGCIERTPGSGPREPDTITIINFSEWQAALNSGTRGGTHGGTRSGTRKEQAMTPMPANSDGGAGTLGGTRAGTHGGTSLTKGITKENEEQPSGAPAPAPKKKRDCKPRGSKPTPSWSASACAIWTKHFDGPAEGGKIGKFLAPLMATCGEDEVLREWDRYLEAMIRTGQGTYARPNDFATRYGYYKEHGVKMPGPNGNGKTRARTTDQQQYGEGTKKGEIRWVD